MYMMFEEDLQEILPELDSFASTKLNCVHTHCCGVQSFSDVSRIPGAVILGSVLYNLLAYKVEIICQ